MESERTEDAWGHAPGPTCWHEAAHAAMAYASGGLVLEVSLECEDDEVGGTTRVVWGANGRRRDPTAELRTALAGPVAETLYRGESLRVGPAELLAAWAGDWRDAQAALARCSSDAREQRRCLQQALDGVHDFMADPRTWERVACLADALHAHETLDEVLVADVLMDLEWAHG